MTFRKRIWGWLQRRRLVAARSTHASREPVTHVVILDGTMSSLNEGCETHAGTTYKLLCELPDSAPVSLYYEAGIQWPDWRGTRDVAFGRGINRQIRRAYGYLASRYHPGDRIVLMGYSRGAFAVRSLAGVIDRIGLLRGEHAIERNVIQAYRHYECSPESEATRAFGRAYCHADVSIEMLGVWETVKALGLRLPLFWMLTEPRHAFHNHQLGPVVRHGFQALALDEARVAYQPLLWACPDEWHGDIEQVWFRGCHGDVGGQLNGFEAARPLANISLVWMLERLERCGMALPEGWRARFPCDADAPSVGMNRQWGKLFLFRRRREVGVDRSESIHPTALDHRLAKRIMPEEGQLRDA